MSTHRPFIVECLYCSRSPILQAYTTANDHVHYIRSCEIEGCQKREVPAPATKSLTIATAERAPDNLLLLTLVAVFLSAALLIAALRHRQRP